MFENFWNKIIGWFRDRSDRRKLILSFNEAAREAFVIGDAPALLEASVSKGDASYRHSFTRWMASGFRIKIFAGRLLTRDEIVYIGDSILSDEKLVRRLIVLGWDTLEIYCEKSTNGLKWNLTDSISPIYLIGS